MLHHKASPCGAWFLLVALTCATLFLLVTTGDIQEAVSSCYQCGMAVTGNTTINTLHRYRCAHVHQQSRSQPHLYGDMDAPACPTPHRRTVCCCWCPR